MDVGIIFRAHSLEFWMERFISSAGQAGIAVVDANVGITNLEVGHVVVAGQPRRHGVGDLVGLGLEAFSLNESAERF